MRFLVAGSGSTFGATVFAGSFETGGGLGACNFDGLSVVGFLESGGEGFEAGVGFEAVAGFSIGGEGAATVVAGGGGGGGGGAATGSTLAGGLLVGEAFFFAPGVFVASAGDGVTFFPRDGQNCTSGTKPFLLNVWSEACVRTAMTFSAEPDSLRFTTSATLEITRAPRLFVLGNSVHTFERSTRALETTILLFEANALTKLLHKDLCHR